MSTLFEKSLKVIARIAIPYVSEPSWSDVLAGVYLNELGWDFNPPPNSLQRTVERGSALVAALARVECLQTNAIPDQERVRVVADLVLALASYVESLLTLPQQIRLDVGSTAADHSGIDRDILRRALDLGFWRYLETELPLLATIFDALGLIEIQAQISHPERYEAEANVHQVRWDRLFEWFETPREVVREVWGWGTDNFNSNRFLSVVTRIGMLLHVGVRMGYVSNRTISALTGMSAPLGEEDWDLRCVQIALLKFNDAELMTGVFSVPPLPSSREVGIGILISVVGSLRGELAFSNGSVLSVHATGPQFEGLSVAFWPNQAPRLNVSTGSDSVRGEVQLRWSRSISAGVASASLGLIGDIASVSVREYYVHSVISVRESTEVRVSLGVREFEFRLSPGRAGGLVGRLLGERDINIKSDAEVAWSSRNGFEMHWNAGVEISVQTATTLGPLQIRAIRFAIRAQDGRLAAELTVACSIALGPVGVFADGIGVSAELSVPAADSPIPSGAFRFKPPNSFAIRVDASVVSGGGLCLIDTGGRRYIGAASLAIGDVSVSAACIIETGTGNDGGYSFLIVISAEFTPIQLGMGFSLNGVGGICGINRAVSVPALQAGVRNGSLAPLLFARDPVAQASQLVTGLGRVFPAAQDRYVFGPMFKLGWGTPTLVTVDLAIVLQLPAPIIVALLGTIEALFPERRAPVVELHIDIAGVLDTGEKTLAIDASLRNSKVAGFDLSGDLALRLRWGDRPDFALAIGGFHRAFRPPEGFPELRRLALSLSQSSALRLTCQAYLALTSNSLQFGARAELYAEALGFNVLGYVEFNALIIFSPFGFRFDFAAGLALRRNTSTLAAITVEGMVAGPRPWHVRGRASISILFIEISVSFDRQFGQPPENRQLETVDVWATQLEPALRAPSNWGADLPTGANRVVSLAAAGTAARTAAGTDAPPLRLDPLGALAFRQRVVPLNQRLTRFGEKGVARPITFRLSAARFGASDARPRALQESFAPGQFQHLTDAEKLSRPSFERMDAGAVFEAADVAAVGVDQIPLCYKTIEVGEERATLDRARYRPGARTLRAALDTAPATLAPLRTTGEARFAPPRGAASQVTLADEQFVIARADTLRPASRPLGTPTASPGAAYAALAARLREHPEERDVWRVLPAYEARISDE